MRERVERRADMLVAAGFGFGASYFLPRDAMAWTGGMLAAAGLSITAAGVLAAWRRRRRRA